MAYFRPPRNRVNDQYRVPKPKSLREVPKYIVTVVKNFFTRLFYIYKLVWEARPSILFVMVFMSVFNGVMPVLGALIGADILNNLAEAYAGRLSDFTQVLIPLIAYFVWLFANSVAGRISGMITRISGEVVSNHIKVKIMNKAREVDMSSFDQPDFYAKMENSNREAGHRPIEILNSSFSVVSTVFSAYIGKVEVLESAAGPVLEQERERRREIHTVPPKTPRTVA